MTRRCDKGRNYIILLPCPHLNRDYRSKYIKAYNIPTPYFDNPTPHFNNPTPPPTITWLGISAPQAQCSIRYHHDFAPHLHLFLDHHASHLLVPFACHLEARLPRELSWFRTSFRPEFLPHHVSCSSTWGRTIRNTEQAYPCCQQTCWIRGICCLKATNQEA